jgi:hypothetical protein
LIQANDLDSDIATDGRVEAAEDHAHGAVT